MKHYDTPKHTFGVVLLKVEKIGLYKKDSGSTSLIEPPNYQYVKTARVVGRKELEIPLVPASRYHQTKKKEAIKKAAWLGAAVAGIVTYGVVRYPLSTSGSFLAKAYHVGSTNSAAAQEAQPPNGGSRRYERSVFDLKVPTNWVLLPSGELEVLQREYEQQSKQLFAEFHGAPQDYDAPVVDLFSLRAPDESAQCVALLTRIPEQATDYLDAMYQRGLDLFEWGRSQGMIDKVLSHERVIVGGLPSVRSVVTWQNGELHTTISFHYPNQPNYAGMLLLIDRKRESSGAHQPAIASLLGDLILHEPPGRSGATSESEPDPDLGFFAVLLFLVPVGLLAGLVLLAIAGWHRNKERVDYYLEPASLYAGTYDGVVLRELREAGEPPRINAEGFINDGGVYCMPELVLEAHISGKTANRDSVASDLITFKAPGYEVT